MKDVKEGQLLEVVAEIMRVNNKKVPTVIMVKGKRYILDMGGKRK